MFAGNRVTSLTSAPKANDEGKQSHRVSSKVVALISLLAICAVSVPARLVYTASTSPSEEDGISGRRMTSTKKSLIRMIDRDWRPSHMRVCQVIMDHFDAGGIAPDPHWGELTFVVDEDEATCNAEMAPNTVLEQIFASAFLAKQGQAHGISVEYLPGCEKYAVPGEVMNVQQSLPSPLLTPAHFEVMDKDVLRNTCVNVLEGNLDENGHSPTHTVIYTKFQHSDTSKVIDHVADFIRLNLRSATIKYCADNHDHSGEHIEDDHRSLFGLKRWLHTLVTAKVNPDGKHSLALASAASLIQEDTAAISLHCNDWQCHDMLVVPFWSYAISIPRSVRVIDILLPKRCTETLSNCLKHAEDVRDFMSGLHPRSKVNIVMANPTSMDHVGRLIEAEYVLCGQGWSSLDCHYPSLSRDDLTTMAYSGGKFMILDGEHAPLGTEVGDTYGTPGTKSHLYRIEQPMVASLRQVLDAGDEGVQQLTNFLRAQPYPSDCRHVRGRQGHWTIDEELVPQLQYKTPYYDGHDDPEKVNDTITPSSMYKWVEGTGFGVMDNGVVGDGNGFCEMSLLTLESLCQTLHDGGLGRIFFLGDAIQLDQVESIWKLLGHDYGPEITVDHRLQPNFRHEVTCPNIPDFTFAIEFVWNDELIESTYPVDMELHEENCNKYCYPWTQRYFDDSSRTVFVVNTGPHFHTLDAFKLGFNRFLKTMNEVAVERHERNRAAGGTEKEDVVLVRTSTPGHQGCDAENLVPHETYEDYHKKAETFGDSGEGWENFEKYNGYAVKAVDLYNDIHGMGVGQTVNQKTVWGARLELLDVFPMTVLRQDGHEEGDCLRYALPGPVDWWNHMLLNNLKDIISSE